MREERSTLGSFYGKKIFEECFTRMKLRMGQDGKNTLISCSNC